MKLIEAFAGSLALSAHHGDTFKLLAQLPAVQLHLWAAA